jgi:uncharacterized protein YggE
MLPYLLISTIRLWLKSVVKKGRNYAKETAYENSPAQVARREARNKARRKAIKKYGKAALKGKELDHVGYHRTGSLDNVPTKVVSRHANRIRQPSRGGKKNSG